MTPSKAQDPEGSAQMVTAPCIRPSLPGSGDDRIPDGPFEADRTPDLSETALVEAGMRPCGWPDCPERFDSYGHIFTGANVQPGWRRSNVVGYLGPVHRNTTHLPKLERTDTGVDVGCDCGWRHENPPTLGTAADLWRDHVRAVST